MPILPKCHWWAPDWLDVPTVAARLFAVLGNAGINIKMISSSEMKITCVVSKDEADTAVKLIHDAFQLDKEPQPVTT